MKKLIKWALLMDGLKAKVLAKSTSGMYVHIYGTERIEEFPHQKKVFTHHLGRIRQHGADQGDHHVFPLPGKPKEIDKENFARKLATFLNYNKELYEEIALIAPDHILGYLRNFLHKDVQRKIYKEVHKDLMRLPLDELDLYLQE
ncbi:MAG: host attachment protein [Pseudomonadota bacterium]